MPLRIFDYDKAKSPVCCDLIRLGQSFLSMATDYHRKSLRVLLTYDQTLNELGYTSVRYVRVVALELTCLPIADTTDATGQRAHDHATQGNIAVFPFSLLSLTLVIPHSLPGQLPFYNTKDK